MTARNKNIPALRFKEFDQEWSNEQIGEVFTFKQGVQSPIDQQQLNPESGYVRFIRIVDLTKNDEPIRYIKDPGKEHHVKSEDLFMVRYGNPGIIGFGFEGVIANNLFRILPLKNKISTKFYSYIFLNKKKDLDLIASSSTMPALNFSALRTLSLNSPTLPEQQKIASFLSAIDEKIRQLTRRKELLEKYKKGVMQQLFSGKLRFKDEQGKAYPKWEQKLLSEFLIPTIREIPKPIHEYLAIGIRSHCKGTFQKPNSDPKKIEMESLFVVKENDLIVNITFAWEGAIALAKKQDDGGLVSHRFPTYTFNRNKVLFEFFKYVFTQRRFRSTLDLISPGGAGRNRVLSKKEFLKIKWTIPSTDEQYKIASFLSGLDTKIESVSAQIEGTQVFKKGLLQKMFV